MAQWLFILANQYPLDCTVVNRNCEVQVRHTLSDLKALYKIKISPYTTAVMLVNSYSNKMFLKVSFSILNLEIKYRNIQMVLCDSIYSCVYTMKVLIKYENGWTQRILVFQSLN